MYHRGPSLCLLLAACTGGDHAIEPLDLSEPLGAGEVRAGVIRREAALFEGIAAEGRIGDVKIYNDRVRFVIQGPRVGSYYIDQGGGVIDADIVRPDGQPGRDAVEEWVGMYGLGRLMDPETVVVVEAGTVSSRARVVVEGPESPMTLLTGVVESPGFIQDLGLRIRTEYTLEADSWLLQVDTILTATGGDATIVPGDVVLGALEVVESWEPVVGLDAPANGEYLWTGYAGRENDVAFGLVAAPGEVVGAGALTAVAAEAGIAGAFGDAVTIPDGASHTYRRYYGVAPDLATLSDAAQALHGIETEAVTGQVTAPDGPVAGARVNVLVGGDPFTLAFTDADGRFSAQVPVGADVSLLAVGRGTGLHMDLPAGAARYAPYAAASLRERTLVTLRDGAHPVPLAVGRGVGGADPLALGEPGVLVLRSHDGLPFAARVDAVDQGPQHDRRLVGAHPGGHAAAAWARDGEVRVPIEPGTYDVLVHRGIRFEAHEERVVVEAGGEVVVTGALPAAYAHPGWLLADPHTHASPSNDGGIAMEDRLIVSAGTGVQLHFGTDHDHVSDYRPLLAPLGLDALLGSVVADEVSPVLRGHHNIYPLEHEPDAPNGGAWAWWKDMPPETAAAYAHLRERHGADIIIQSNHPMSSGLASAASWSPGRIGRPQRWATDFQAVEVANRGNLAGLPFYLDLISRGVLVAPVAVTDSHSHLQGNPGLNATFLGMGSDDPADYSDDALREAMRARRTIATRGPFLALSIEPGSVVTGATSLDVQALAPSWIQVDRLQLLRDGVVIEQIDGSSGSFALDPDQDAAYVVIASGDRAMAPVYPGETPWAASSAILVDVNGDGWEAPLPALVVE